jgi:hypothetical protein
MPLLAPVTSAAEFSMAPKVPAKPAWWQAAAAFQPVRTPSFAERTVAWHNPVTNTRRAHRRRSVLGQSLGPGPLEARRTEFSVALSLSSGEGTAKLSSPER